MRHLHEHGLVHRDIKPSNIIFVGGVPKLADIGLVASMDATMSFVGTSGFLPPEGPGTPQADIYSLGKVLYEISMGRDRQEFPKLPPDLIAENEKAPSGTRNADPQTGAPKSNPHSAFRTPHLNRLLELNAVILKACHHDPRQRYPSAEELRADLALLQGGQSVRRRRAVEHRFSVAKRIAVAVVVLGLLLGVLLWAHPFKRGKTANPESVRLYELGRWHQEQFTDDHLKKAIQYLNQAIQIDPEYVPAYTALFRIYEWSSV